MSEDRLHGDISQLLTQRAELLHQIRNFMARKKILEIETPVLAHTTVSDPNIQSFTTTFHCPGNNSGEKMYLHTSPEYAMKRLLAMGSGPIYQITHVFRDTEAGRLHNPEFTMLEWYQPGFDHNQLMDQLDELLQILGFEASEKKNYVELFKDTVGINPHTADLQSLQNIASDNGLISTTDDKAALLDYIFSHMVCPGFNQTRPLFVSEYPACQCALARLTDSDPPVARRFELFIRGIEIANGYHELCDVHEQRRRFEKDIELRRVYGKAIYPIDEKFLEALAAGLPDCAGVSIGLDRLLMVMYGYTDISDVITFPVNKI